jgi:hypothetical protein
MIASKFPNFFLLLIYFSAIGVTSQNLVGNERVALVIGNSSYHDAGSIPSLPNASSDAKLVGEALRKSGFAVTTAIDLTSDGIRKAVLDFASTIPRNGESVFFFAGHGIEVQKEPAMLGVDASLVSGNLTPEASVQIESIVEQIAERRPRVMLYFLDCCRELISVNGGAQRGIQQVVGPTYDNYPEMLISFSSEPGGVALDGQELGLPNSPYSESLATAIADGLEVGDLMTKVRREVFRITGGRQRTWDSSSMVSEYFFAEKGFTLDSETRASEAKMESDEGVVRTGGVGKDWDIIKYRGREYVDVENIARFFGFDEMKREGERVIFKHPNLVMAIVGGSHEIYINGVLFYSSLPMPEIEGTTLVSTVDLAKLIDPVVRPNRILSKEDDGCDFVFLFDETRITGEGEFSIHLKSFLSEANLPIKVFVSSSEKERSEWLTEQSQAKDVRAVYFRLDVAGLPSNGIRAMTVAPQGTPPTGESMIDVLPFSMLANQFDRENIALATAFYAHLCSDLGKFKMQELGVGRTLRPEMRAITCPAALIEIGRPSGALRAEPERLARAIVDAAIRFRIALGIRVVP